MEEADEELLVIKQQVSLSQYVQGRKPYTQFVTHILKAKNYDIVVMQYLKRKEKPLQSTFAKNLCSTILSIPTINLQDQSCCRGQRFHIK